MNKKKELNYLWINELEKKVIKEQKQERKRHGNKRQEGKTARKADYKPHGSRNREQGRNRGTEQESGRGTGASGRTEETRTEIFLDKQHGRSRAEDGKTNKERKNELKIKTEIENWKEKPRWKVIWIYPICYRLPPTERFGFVNYFSILGQCTESGLIWTTENKFFNYVKINLDVIWVNND